MIARIAAGLAVSALVLVAASGAGPHPHPAASFACRMEPSATVEGFEIIGYPADHAPDPRGFPVPCPR